MLPPQAKQHHVLYRMEWNPTGNHSNALDCADPDLSGLWFGPGDSHEHSCLDHLTDGGVVRANDVHCARPLVVEPTNFKDALTYVCARINVENGGVIPQAVAQGELV
jgi:hypothetical protein